MGASKCSWQFRGGRAILDQVPNQERSNPRGLLSEACHLIYRAPIREDNGSTTQCSKSRYSGTLPHSHMAAKRSAPSSTMSHPVLHPQPRESWHIMLLPQCMGRATPLECLGPVASKQQTRDISTEISIQRPSSLEARSAEGNRQLWVIPNVFPLMSCMPEMHIRLLQPEPRCTPPFPFRVMSTLHASLTAAGTCLVTLESLASAGTNSLALAAVWAISTALGAPGTYLGANLCHAIASSLLALPTLARLRLTQREFLHCTHSPNRGTDTLSEGSSPLPSCYDLGREAEFIALDTELVLERGRDLLLFLPLLHRMTLGRLLPTSVPVSPPASSIQTKLRGAGSCVQCTAQSPSALRPQGSPARNRRFLV